MPASFSNVKYSDIAPYVWLDPLAKGADILRLGAFRSRIPNDLFRSICKDVDDATSQYGRMDSHENEEARSRYLASVRVSPYFPYTFDSKRNTVVFGNRLPVRECSSQ